MNRPPASPEPFLSVDWGTTALRVTWAGGPGDRTVRTDDGAARLALVPGDRGAGYRSALARARRILGAPVDLPVIVSGMAGSSIGWRELPYARLPFPLDGAGVRSEWVEPGVLLLSGLRGDTEMMRGEETQALGVAALLGAELPPRAVLVLPGTHSKHLDIEDGALTGIRTHMTGELFDILCQHSILRHSVAPPADPGAKGFAAGVRAGLEGPLGAALFRVRTRQVLDGCLGPDNAAYLSGLLIGAELAALAVGESGTAVILAADGMLGAAYRAAAAIAGLASRFRWLPAAPLAALGHLRVLTRISEKA